jgi:hypothetical protein
MRHDEQAAADFVESVARAIETRHEVTALPRVSRELRERIGEGFHVLTVDVDAWYQAAIGQVPQLIPDEAGAPVILKVLVCAECGTRGVPRAGQLHCPDHPGVELDYIDYPVRKLPEGFQHLQSVLATGISKRWLRRLQRDIEGQRQAAVWLSECGFHRHNAQVLLRYVATQSGVPVDDGRFTFEGEGSSGLVRFHADSGGVPL